MSEKDQAAQVKEDRERYDQRRADMAVAPDAEEVQTKAAKGEEALTLRELEAINMPPARPHNDEAEIGKRYEGSDYAPAAQPDLNAPAYVLARQAKLAVDGDSSDTRINTAADVTPDDQAAAEEKQEQQDDAAAKKAAAKKA